MILTMLQVCRTLRIVEFLMLVLHYFTIFFTNKVVNDISRGLLVTYVSNHLPVFALCNYIDNDWPKEKCFKYVHDTRVDRIEAFGAAVSVQDRDLITKHNDVNKSYEGFINTFNELYYSMHCLLKRCASEINYKIGHGLLKVWQMRVKRRTICIKIY